jgi:hypothetical protein
MWAFPLLSRQYDAGNVPEARRTLRFALIVYAATGLVLLAALLVGMRALPLDTSLLPHGLYSVALITIASLLWHCMSIAHKPFELKQQTSRMASLMAIGTVIFQLVNYILIEQAKLNAFVVVQVSLIAVALTYAIVSFSQKLEQ